MLSKLFIFAKTFPRRKFGHTILLLPHLSVVVVLAMIQFLNGCSSSKQTPVPQSKSAHTIIVPDSLVKRQASGTDFFATGNVPRAWTLDLDVDKEFIFNAGDIKANITAVKSSKPSVGQKKYYRSSTTSGDMEIIIYEETCDNPGHAQKVEVKFNNTLYTGCGAYLYDPQLNGTWILEQRGKEIFKASDFPKGLPVLVFNTYSNLLSGTDGCGTFNGPISVIGSRINFGSLKLSDKLCKKQLIKEILKYKLSNLTADYFFKNGKLVLYLIDDSQLILRKGN